MSSYTCAGFLHSCCVYPYYVYPYSPDLILYHLVEPGSTVLCCARFPLMVITTETAQPGRGATHWAHRPVTVQRRTLGRQWLFVGVGPVTAPLGLCMPI